MEHFYNNIPGWFTWPRLYKDIINKFPSGSHFVEVGVYRGCSFAYLIVEIINAEKNITVTAVDSFIGVDSPQGYGIYVSKKLSDEFLNNMNPVHDKFDLIIDQSWDAANNIEDKSLDFVFIDASHEYESVKKDIKAWLPKIKTGGILAGHDYSSYEGVKIAVDEIFGDNISQSYIDELCWLVVI